MPSYDDFLDALAMQESTDNPYVMNARGYVGLYQMGEQSLQDAGYYLRDPASTSRNSWTGMWTGNDGINSLSDFENNPSAQTDALNAFFAQNTGYIHNLGLNQYIGSQVTLDDGTTIPVTGSGMLAAAHLGGIGGLNSFLKSGGANDPNDSGKSISDYMQQFAGYDTPFDFGTTPNPADYSHFLDSPFDLSASFGGSNPFTQAFMTSGWDQLPSFSFPDPNANFPVLNAHMPDLNAHMPDPNAYFNQSAPAVSGATGSGIGDFFSGLFGD